MNKKRWMACLLSLTLVFSMFAATAAAEETPAVELRGSLDHLLSEHYALSVIAMIKLYDSAPDWAEAQDALAQNAEDMKPAIQGLYGDQAATEFGRIFGEHNAFTLEYVDALKRNDEEDAEEALDKLDGFAEEFAAFLADATDGELPLAAGREAIELHESQVTAAFDYYMAGNYNASFEMFREGFNTMFAISDVLSQAIVAQNPDAVEGTDPATEHADIVSQLNRLAAEHYVLAVIGMQFAFDEHDAYAGVMHAEDANTADLRAVIAASYDEEAAAQFERIWTGNHIAAQEEIAEAALSGTANQINDARAKFDVFAEEFGEFLEAATEGDLEMETIREVIQMHEADVLAVFDHYQRMQYEDLYERFREGYAFMFGFGPALSVAVSEPITEAPEEGEPGSGEEPIGPEEPREEAPEQPELPGSLVITMQVGNTSVVVNGESWSADVAPIVEDGITFVSLRTLAESLDADLDWNQQSKSAGLTAGLDTASFQVGESTAEVNGESMDIGYPVFVYEGRTQLPLRFVAEMLGWELDWDANSQSITLTKEI